MFPARLLIPRPCQAQHRLRVESYDCGLACTCPSFDSLFLDRQFKLSTKLIVVVKSPGSAHGLHAGVRSGLKLLRRWWPFTSELTKTCLDGPRLQEYPRTSTWSTLLLRESRVCTSSWLSIASDAKYHWTSDRFVLLSVHWHRPPRRFRHRPPSDADGV